MFIVHLLFGCHVATLKLSSTIVPSQHREAPGPGTASSRHTTRRLPSTCVRALCESRASNCAGRKRDAQLFSSSCATQRTLARSTRLHHLHGPRHLGALLAARSRTRGACSTLVQHRSTDAWRLCAGEFVCSDSLVTNLLVSTVRA